MVISEQEKICSTANVSSTKSSKSLPASKTDELMLNTIERVQQQSKLFIITPRESQNGVEAKVRFAATPGGKIAQDLLPLGIKVTVNVAKFRLKVNEEQSEQQPVRSTSLQSQYFTTDIFQTKNQQIQEKSTNSNKIQNKISLIRVFLCICLKWQYVMIQNNNQYDVVKPHQ
ncbi:Hypothetical_protein [Hexamita inflata]|uniref:Hypothetical_protein n=1 Tax=Hexamita inflata TaxID=28002 RepID=A0ABP1HPJ0_9EUKA